LLDLDGSQHWLSQRGKLAQCSYWGALEFRRAAQQREKREANDRHRKQGAYKD
jgi:hypothetical protein